MTSRPSIAGSAVWRTIGAGSGALIQLIGLFILARLLEPVDFGLATLALAVIQLLNLFTGHLFSEALVQIDTLKQEHVDSAFVVSMGVAGVLIAGCVAGAATIAQLLQTPDLSPLLLWMCAGLGLSPIQGVLSALLRREMQFRHLAIATVTGRLAGTGLSVGMAFAGMGVWSFVGQYLGTCGAVTLAVIWMSKWRPRIRFSLFHVRELGRFALNAQMIDFFSTAEEKIFYFLVNYLFGPVGVGYVNLAARLSDHFGRLILDVTHDVNLSTFARQLDSKELLRRSVYTAASVCSLFAFPAFLGIMVVAGELTNLAFGGGWHQVVFLAQLFAAAYLFEMAMSSVDSALYAIGRPGWYLLGGFAFLVLEVLGLLMFADFGVRSTGIVILLATALTKPVDLWVAHKLFGLKARALLRRVLWPLGCALGMGAVLVTVKAVWLKEVSDIKVLLVLVPLGMAVYGAFIWLAEPSLVRTSLGLGTGAVEAEPSNP